MDLTPVSLVLAVSTAWATLFLGVLSPPALRLQSWEILKVCGAWMLVALTPPSSIFHWYFIFAFICLVAWVHLRRDRVLAAKTWLSFASGLGISLGVIFFIQAAPVLCPASLPLRSYLLLLASIYLGGAVSGLAYVRFVLSRDPTPHVRGGGYAKLLFILTIAWALVFALESREVMTNSLPRSGFADHANLLCIPILLLPVLAIGALYTNRSTTTRIWATVSLLAFGTNVFARWLLM
jgi:hypothetical protein